LYNGTYLLRISDGKGAGKTFKVVINR
jgi:hypothetical protein